MNVLLMAIADFQLPEWLTVGTLATTLGSLVALITGFIRSSGTNKLTKSMNSEQLGVLTKIVDKVADFKETTGEVVDKVSEVIKKVDDSLAQFKEGLNNQTNANINLASFILECFKESNLSTDKKAKLQVLCDQLFYTDHTQLVDKLREAKSALEDELVAAKKKEEELQKQLKEEQDKLAEQQAVVKKSRRIS